MIFIPFERGDSPLSNGEKIVQNGSLDRQIWTILVDDFKLINFTKKRIINTFSSNILILVTTVSSGS